MSAKTSGQGAGRFLQHLVTGNPKTTSLSADWESEPQMRTVEFNLTPKEQPSYPIKCEALVSYSVMGNTVTRRLSVVNGAAISGVCEAIKVTISDNTTVPFAAPTFEYSVDVIVAPGTRGFGHQPPYLEQQSNALLLAAGVSHDFLIPKDSGATSVFITTFSAAGDAPAAGELVAAQMQGTFTGKEYDPRNYPTWVPLSPGTDKVTVSNLSVAKDAFVTVTIGIDG
jgi:hypothetical protein